MITQELKWSLSVLDHKTATFRFGDMKSKSFEASSVNHKKNKREISLEALGISYS